MLKIYSTVILIILSFQQICGQQKRDLCSIKSGTPGICKEFVQCPKAQADLKQGKTFPKLCGFVGIQPLVCCPPEPGEISKAKCKEYAVYVHENPLKKKKNECGHGRTVPLILGGTAVQPREFPHMAAIGFEPEPGKIEWSCGGTIISPHYILTAAHCLIDRQKGNATWIKVGVIELNDTQGQQIKIKELIAHPQYNGSSYYYDLGLIKLEKGIRMNPYTRPACLYTKEMNEVEKVVATGWGQTSATDLKFNNKLLKVQLDISDEESCKKAYKTYISRRFKEGILDDMQFCAGSSDGEKDTCQGDSGGPLQIFHVGDEVECMYDIIGVTSFGKACGSKTGGVYQKVPRYIEWIEKVVWG